MALALLAFCAVPSAIAAPAPTSWADLAEGEVAGYDWTVKVKRPEGPAGNGRQGALRPCLLVGTTWRQGPFSLQRTKQRQCTDPSSRLTTSEPLMVASGVRPTNAAPADLTTVGMIFARPTHRVRVTFADGSTDTMALLSMTPDQAKTAGLGRFRYAAFAVRGLWCAERVVSLDAAGNTLWDSGTDEYTCAE